MDTFRVRPRELGELREALAYGLANFGLAVETAGKRHCPVRGGFRSFNPDQPIGGNLRRSIHSIAYLDGRALNGSPSSDENGAAIEAYAGDGISVFVGTNAGYGFWVHEGTSRMESRPFLVEGLLEEKDHAGALIAAGARRRIGG